MALSSIPPDLTYASLNLVLKGFFANMILTFAGVSLFCLNPPTSRGCMCLEQPFWHRLDIMACIVHKVVDELDIAES